ncbi:PepSY domain-containing protein [Gracilibacillus sp. YIM 98692]|uniref:PepSY domain-containing protein n=1 Tax=Gracilibacillus sp. YIM 98692 TaxID=2663532 RepID=UPI0013D2C47C|nr:PepSY domain-containing protein [Gracilibacillus sp. YIM 98692]
MLVGIIFVILISIILLFLFVLRKHIFNKKIIYILMGMMVIWGGYKLVTMPFISKEEAVVKAKKTVAPYTYRPLYRVNAEIYERNTGGSYWSVAIAITNGSYAEVYIDARSGEILSAKINKLNGNDIEIKER